MTIGPEALSHNPKLAAMVMRAIAEWAHIEGNQALILSNCLKSDIVTGTAMYQALASADAKRAALEAAASKALSDADFQLFLTVMKVIKPFRDRRNAFAHNVWACTQEIPNALMLMRPDLLLNHSVEWRQYVEDNKRPTAVSDGQVNYVLSIPPNYQLDYSQIEVFREADLRRDIRNFDEAAKLVSLLYRLTRYRGGDAEARQELLADPRVSSFLRPQNP